MPQKIIRLQVRNLRSLKSFSCSFSPGINEIIGKNGRGKTTLLEAIVLFITGSSFRTSFLKELIAHSERGFLVEALFEKEGHENELKIVFEGNKRTIFLNQNHCSPQMLLGLVNGVISTSQDSMLIQGAPSLRRRFLDLQIAQANPLYVHHYSRYQRALKQRNTLIRNKNVATIAAWEKELALSGAYIVQERRAAITALNITVKDFFSHFVDDFPGQIQLREISSCPEDNDAVRLREYFEEQYCQRRQQEFMYGQTLVGPHRHDLSITADQKPCRDFASEGEVRVLAIALRFAEWRLLYEKTQEKPIFLADDVRAHLDEKRLEKVLNLFLDLGQVVVTGQEGIHPLAQKLIL